MQISRRHLIGSGAAAGGLALLAGPPLFAKDGVPASVAPAVTPQAAPLPVAAPAPVPARPRVAVDPIVDPRLVARARASFDRHRSQITHVDVVGITDFARESNLHRFFLLDAHTGRVTRHFVSHGRGSDPGHTGFLQRFSNAFGSNATSSGGYLTSAYYHGKYGRSMRLKGLDHTNSNAEARAIVIHTAWYAEPDIIREQGRLGRSEGCFALPGVSHQEALARLGPGRFLYADRV